jgi:diketogulonate reductase-like aldo/keto reductase
VIMDRAHEHSINFFDTANVYGAQPGVTEQIIGRWFAEDGGRREKTALATELHLPTGDDGALRALTITLDDRTLARLDELFPPPAPNGAKPAPEAYAW